MGAFYVKDRQVMGWLHYWVLHGAPTTGRPLLADQLRRVRKRYGSGVARQYRDHLVWIGSYPVR